MDSHLLKIRSSTTCKAPRRRQAPALAAETLAEDFHSEHSEGSEASQAGSLFDGEIWRAPVRGFKKSVPKNWLVAKS